jgi:two-component system cell cycle sensor histidine kinase/response regulator CckA
MPSRSTNARDSQWPDAAGGLWVGSVLTVLLLGHLLAYASWYDDIGQLAGLFVVPAGLFATARLGQRGALLVFGWALGWNALLGATLPLPDGAVGLVRTLFHPLFLFGHLGLGMLLRVLGKKHDLEQELRLKLAELARSQELLRDTERIREEARLSHRLSRTERMASVGTLASGIAHEVNNPLTYVIGNLYYALEQLERAGREPEAVSSQEALHRELGELLRDALDGAQRVRRIVRDLKTFSRATDDDSEQRIDVNAALGTAVNLVNNEIRHRARLALALGDVPRVVGSEPKLVQAFVNLLMNAAQAIPEGRPDSELIEVRSALDGLTRVRIDFRDSGSGISPELLTRIFDPFFTTKPGASSTGIGLSVAHGIVQAMGGELTVDSREGEGSTFSVVLPAEESERTHPGLRRTPPAPRPGKLRVLVVDDEPKVGISLGRMLRDWEVHVVEDGRDALELLRQGASFDVVLCDLMMPHVSGMDLFEQVRGRDAELARRFVFMTGGAFTPRAREFVAEVPNVTLEKPFDKAQVLAAVQGVRESAAKASS